MNPIIITQTLNLPNTTPLVTKRFSVSTEGFEAALINEINLSREAVAHTGRTFPNGVGVRFVTPELVLSRLIQNKVGAIAYEDADGFTLYVQFAGFNI